MSGSGLLKSSTSIANGAPEAEGVYPSEAKEPVLTEGEKQELEREEIEAWLEGFDKDHVWAFNSGSNGQSFGGNPKYLFIYVNYYRPDIRAYWICRSKSVIETVESLGFKALFVGTPAAEYAAVRTGVVVNEQVRGYIPFPKDVKYLNLWHGHGFKTSERARLEDGDDMRFELATKYIKNNRFYQNQEIIVCVNPLQERLFLPYMGVPAGNLLHAGYTRCTYQSRYKRIATFDHDILSQKGLPENTRIAVYAPTFRSTRGSTFLKAFTDLERLYCECEKNNILLVFKMHPQMEKEDGFLKAKEAYGDRPFFFFWDNNDDIYEIIDKIDLLIYDYSSIFNDFLLAGVKHYIRYIFDYENMVKEASINSEEEYYYYTYGTICKTYDELLVTLSHYEEESDPETLDRIKKQQWEYSDEDDFEKIIRFTMDFKPGDVHLPTLYSYDIFDTLFTRKGLDPRSIFYQVKDRLRSSGSFDAAFAEMFPEARINAEANVRANMSKSVEQRKSIRTEITLQQIYDRIRSVYHLSREQSDTLMRLETEAEIDSVLPLPERIEELKAHLAEGDTVILISDMYLPRDVIEKMLEKADPILTQLPMFLSNEYGVLKSNRLLFFEVYRSFKPYYNFAKWIHTGDNLNSDQNQPRKLSINTRLVESPKLNTIENALAKSLNSYNGYLIAAMQARLNAEFQFGKAPFIIDYVAPLFVSYVDWAVRDAIEKGFETLYFVARDGHPLKLIADALIEANHWSIKTKYLYASRKVWRIPSYIDEIDVDFWSNYGGNFNDIHSKKHFLMAAAFEREEQFREFFPQIDLNGINFNDWSNGQPARKLVPFLRNNEAYCRYLLDLAAEQRGLVCAYLRQEIDPSEKHAFIEFWGRGYNQTCHSRLWNFTLGREVPTVYYYARTNQFSEGNCIRYNMTTNNIEFYFLETIFANMPYKSLERYTITDDGRVEPVIEPVPCVRDLYDGMNLLLPEYARRYAALQLENPVWTDRQLFEFLLDYYTDNKRTPFIYENFGSLEDAVSIYGQRKEFAKPFTKADLTQFATGVPRTRTTMSITMSYARSQPDVQLEYNKLYQIDSPDKDVADSSVLMPNALKKSESSRKEYEKALSKGKDFRKKYNAAASANPIGNNVVLLQNSAELSDLGLCRLFDALREQSYFSVEPVLLKSGISLDDVAVSLAKARFIILESPIPLLCDLVIRPGSDMILMAPPFRLYNYGYLLNTPINWEKKLTALKAKNDFTLLQAPSPEEEAFIRRCVSFGGEADHVLYGSCLTDVYFDEELRIASREKLEELVPQSASRKVVLYIPTLRLRENSTVWADILDLDLLCDLLGDEYLIILNLNEKQRKERSWQNFTHLPENCVYMDISDTSEMTLRQLAIAADVIVGDYRDTVYECALMNKPVFFTAYDYERLIKNSKNLTYRGPKYSSYIYGPLAETEAQLAELIKHADEYDYTAMQRFRERVFSDCDGHSTQRLVSFICDKYQAPPDIDSTDDDQAPQDSGSADNDQAPQDNGNTDMDQELPNCESMVMDQKLRDSENMSMDQKFQNSENAGMDQGFPDNGGSENP